MKLLRVVIISMAYLSCVLFSHAQNPYLKKNANNATQLIVDGKPFLMLAGEVNNSSGSNIQYMEKTMKALHEANLNSVLVSVSWEIIEPQEGVFDFTSVDALIRIARENDMKLGILWFASWKNSLSPYAPVWVINDAKRFERVQNEKGENTRILTPLCAATRDADANAFAEFMKHVAAVDKDNTIIVVQIENEVGTLGQTRDFSAKASKAFQSQVPQALMQYLVKNKKNLEIELKTAWETNGSKIKGTWAEIFGKSDETDLFFMAWNYSQYLNVIAEAGKKVHNIPMYANCWMPNPRPNPGKPGNYPSGGPILTVLDIWKAGAPFIDILGPDLYGGDFKDEANFFHRDDNPLFIPETNTTDGPATYAFAQEDAICFSPFGIDNRGDVTAKEYGLIKQLMPLIAQYQGSGKMMGFYKSNGDSVGRDIELNDDVLISIQYQKPRGFGRPAANATTTPVRQADQACYGIFIKTGENEFILSGANLSVRAYSRNQKKEVWLKDAWEGTYTDNGVWTPVTLHNGDEASFLRSGDPIYNIRGYKSSDPAIFHFKTAVYNR